MHIGIECVMLRFGYRQWYDYLAPTTVRHQVYFVMVIASLAGLHPAKSVLPEPFPIRRHALGMSWWEWHAYPFAPGDQALCNALVPNESDIDIYHKALIS